MHGVDNYNIYIYIMIINIVNFNSNIGHFLHEELQYVIDIIFKNDDAFIDIYIPDYVLNNKLYRWHIGILNVLTHQNKKIKLIYDIKNYNNVINIVSSFQKIINIDYIIYLRKIVFEYYNIEIINNQIPYTVLYTRINDTNRRHILNYECLVNNFDLIVHSLDLSFEEQVKLFSKITHFVSVEGGAHFVNIMFMQPTSKAMNILTRTDFSTIDNRPEHYDSWQKRFGTSILIKEFNINNSALTRITCNSADAVSDHDMHDHIYIDDILKHNIIDFINEHSLIISHPGYHGFFSYCSVTLLQIMLYFNKNKKIPYYVDMSKIFTFFKKNENDDISEVFFKKNDNNININNDTFINIIDQFDDYSNINFVYYNQFIQKYFTLSDEINNIILNIEHKYNINYDNTCCIFLRGNDKITETIIPDYDEIYNKLNDIIPDKENINFLLQSDESEFFSFFKLKLKNIIIFNDEIKHINKQNTSINHIIDYDNKIILIKNFLAIVKIMSKCKYVICNAGNISLWITLFRNNNDNIFQFLNNNWCK